MWSNFQISINNLRSAAKAVLGIIIRFAKMWLHLKLFLNRRKNLKLFLNFFSY